MASRNVVYKVGRNRESGVEVYVIDNRNRKAFPKIESKWVTECMTHREICGHTRRLDAEAIAHHPTRWCDACREAGTARSQSPAPKSNAKAVRLEIDRKVYLAVFENWALEAKEIAASTGLDIKEVSKSLNRMRTKGLVDHTQVNEDPAKIWQTMFDSENGDTTEEALASFDAAHGVAA